MSQLLLISAIMFLPGTSSAEQAVDSEDTPPPIRIGDYELFAKSVKIRTDSSIVHCALEGDAWIRRGEFIARADFMSIVIDHGEHQSLSLKGNCEVKDRDFSGTAETVEISTKRQLMVLEDSDDANIRLSEKSTIRGRRIVFELETRRVNVTSPTQ